MHFSASNFVQELVVSLEILGFVFLHIANLVFDTAMGDCGVDFDGLLILQFYIRHELQ